MTPFALWFSLGLCYGFVPDDDEQTFALCQLQFEAQQRHIEPGLNYWGEFRLNRGLVRLRIVEYLGEKYEHHL